MKITNLNTGFNSSNHYGKPVKESDNITDNRPGFKKASGGEDFIEISREALIKHREAKIINFTEALIKKEAARPDDQYGIKRADKTGNTSQLREMAAAGRYNFDDEYVLSETAERLLAFLE